MKRWGRPRVRPAASHSPTRESQSKKTQNMKYEKTKHTFSNSPLLLLDKIILLIKTYLLRNPIWTKNFPPVAGVHIVVVVTNRELVSERVTSRFSQG